ncbi:hypothetical protein WA026_002133 [Henosepilachna vigintioctopunctata]|uniref:Reverse transcriptase n=1 Tax=Henosepilachna vigintioctopunctata TaxID=420089 RepID=A0AAW1TQI0_9CUCU
MKAATEKVIEYYRQEARKPWMTKEILNKMEYRRIAKLENNDIKFNQIHKDVRKKIRQAKEQWLTEQCPEAEKLHEMHDSFIFHKKFQEITTTQNLTQQEDITGPPILVSEVEYAVANLKDGKAPGEDMIHAEVLKLMDPKILCRFFNKIYDSGIIPLG